MTQLLIKLKIYLINLYKYLLSPLLGNNCRYLTPCSDYYIVSLKKHGLLNGSYMGIKRILSCHPFNFLGGGSSLDFVKGKNKSKRENSNG
jgi:uncharacterized protein